MVMLFVTKLRKYLIRRREKENETYGRYVFGIDILFACVL